MKLADLNIKECENRIIYDMKTISFLLADIVLFNGNGYLQLSKGIMLL